MATAGSILPSKNSKKAPPPVVKPKPKKAAASGEPTFLSKLENRAVTEGNLVRMDVKLKMEPDLTVEWFFGDELINSEEFLHITPLVDEDLFSLLITRAKKEDSGIYTCCAKNSNGTAKCSGKLTVTGVFL